MEKQTKTAESQGEKHEEHGKLLVKTITIIKRYDYIIYRNNV